MDIGSIQIVLCRIMLQTTMQRVNPHGRKQFTILVAGFIHVHAKPFIKLTWITLVQLISWDSIVWLCCRYPGAPTFKVARSPLSSRFDDVWYKPFCCGLQFLFCGHVPKSQVQRLSASFLLFPGRRHSFPTQFRSTRPILPTLQGEHSSSGSSMIPQFILAIMPGLIQSSNSFQ